MHLNPDQERAIRAEFDAPVNLEPAELKAWLKRPESAKVGMVRRGETESVGRQSPRRILAIRATPVDDLTDADYAHMRGEEVFKATPGSVFEYACHEGNYPLPGILGGARVQEKAAARASVAPDGG